jgi:membrane-bound lytic murein transglycosylase B
METAMTLRKKFMIFVGSLLAAACLSSACFAETPASVNESIDKFIAEMVEKNHFDANYLKSLFSHVHLDATVTEKMNKPYEGQPWTVYRNFFITDERVANGVQYWQQHSKELARAEKVYGVPASVIVAIIGVESKYGTKQGDFPTFQTLTTLAFNYPSRAKFFTSELEHFLLMTREQKFDPLAIKGSYAGAIGMPQFMPSSYRNYAVNFEGGKNVNLISNDADVISSVGNYLKRNGWQENQLVAVPAKATANALKNIKQEPLKPAYTLQELHALGVAWDQKLPFDAKAAFFTVEFDKKNQHWVALNNFQVISRYNHNMQYVLAVHEFSQAIKAQRLEALKESREQRG